MNIEGVELVKAPLTQPAMPFRELDNADKLASCVGDSKEGYLGLGNLLEFVSQPCHFVSLKIALMMPLIGA